MSDARAQRDRRLIQRTATLLSEDYPLEQLIERACDALCSELDVTIAFVALADDHHHLEVEAFVSVEDGLLPDLGPQSAALVAYESNEPVLRTGGRELAVPIAYRDETIGVLVLLATRATLDEQDERLVGAIARYLGIAIRNQRLPAAIAATSRSPIVAVVSVATIALVLTAAIVAFTALRVSQSQEAANDVAAASVRAVVSELSDYVLDARQVTNSTARIVGDVRGDRRRVETALVAMLESARSESIYGVGAWYQPYAFDGKTRWYGPYAHWDSHHRAVLTYEWMRPSYDFHRQPWYRLGTSARHQTKFTDPYFDTDHTYVTAARAFSSGSHVAGVVTVDSIVPTLRSTMPLHVSSGNYIAVTSATGNVLVTSDKGRVEAQQLAARVGEAVGSNPATFSAVVPYTRWRVQLWRSRSLYEADARRLEFVAGAALLGIWLAAALTVVVALRTRRTVRRVLVLEEQRAALQREVSERMRAEERLREHAFRDELTGLPNRASFLGQLAAHLQGLHVDPEQTFAVLFIDIDRFNLINDSLGHATGDHLLTEFGNRMRSHVRPGDVLARMSGDEFVLLARFQEQGEARRRAAEILQALRHPFTISGLEFYTTASIGIALSDARYEAPEEMLRDADVAMYEAKRAGRSTFRLFDRSMHADTLKRLALETDLRRALERDEIFVEYQPLVALGDGSIAGFEALARWNHPTRGPIPPEVFIKVAEQSGMIVEIDERVVGIACAAASGWRQEKPDLFVAVNFSAAHLARVDDLAIVRRALDAAGLPATALKIEITESAVMENAEKAFALLIGLRELGVTVVVDDFGTGYSSLSHLQRLPVEELKIDRSFIGTMVQNEKSAEIVRAILAISKTLRLAVTAEGVETQEQAERLRRMGVEFAQGLHFGMSVDAAMAQRVLRTRLKRSVRV